MAYYVEWKPCRYKKIRGSDDMDEQDAKEYINEHIANLSEVGYDLYLCDTNKKRVCVYKFIQGDCPRFPFPSDVLCFSAGLSDGLYYKGIYKRMVKIQE